MDEQTATILEFLENDEYTVIAAVHNKDENTLKFHHRIPNDEVSLLFYKIPQVGTGRGNSGGGAGGGRSSTSTTSTALPPSSTTLGGIGGDNQPLGILTLEGGLVKSIYNSVSRVFSPHANVRVSFAAVIPTFHLYFSW